MRKIPDSLLTLRSSAADSRGPDGRADPEIVALLVLAEKDFTRQFTQEGDL